METKTLSTAPKKSLFARLGGIAIVVTAAAAVLSGCYIERGPYRPYAYHHRPHPVIIVR